MLHVIETATGRVLPDTISRALFGVSSWRADNGSFYYLRERKLEPGEPAIDKEQKLVTYLHVLGADPEKDVPVAGYGIVRGDRAGTDRLRGDRNDPRIELRPAGRAKRRAERSAHVRRSGGER